MRPDKRGILMSLKDLIMLNAKDYLEIDSDVYINLIMLFIALALCVASFFINYHKTYTVSIIKQLLRHDATNEEKAKTLASLHLEDKRGLKAALSRNGQLTAIIKRVGHVEPTYEEYMALLKEKKQTREKIDFKTALFYIPEENVAKAKLIKERENPTLMRTSLVCVLILALFVCLMLLMPEILRFISGIGDT